MFKKIFKKIPPTTIPMLACVVLLCALAFIISYRVNAASTGGLIGQSTGTMVGKAIGSLEGLTVGQRDGYAAGKAKGLSAEDTTAELSGKIKEVAKLQVLVASGTYTDMITVGENEDYAAIISQQYNAVFTVNLATANIELREDGLHIELDQPKAEFLPIGEVSILNEYQKHGYKGSAADGYTAAINAINKLKEEGMKAFAGYDSMLQASRVSAEEQLIGLVKAVSLSKPEVIIEWRAE